MHPNALLDLATELLRQVLKLDQPADAVVSAFFRKHRGLGQRERHSLAETTYAVLRQRLRLAYVAGVAVGQRAQARRIGLVGVCLFHWLKQSVPGRLDVAIVRTLYTAVSRRRPGRRGCFPPCDR